LTNYLENVDSDWFSKRLSVTLTVVIAAFVVLIARLLFLQVIEGEELRRLSEINSIRLKSVDAPRGIDLRYPHRLMADNRPSYDLSVIVKDADPLERTIEKLSRYTGIDENNCGSGWSRPKGPVPTNLSYSSRYQPGCVGCHRGQPLGSARNCGQCLAPKGLYLQPQFSPHIGIYGRDQRRRSEKRDLQ
jgi:hypothetical protein